MKQLLNITIILIVATLVGLVLQSFGLFDESSPNRGFNARTFEQQLDKQKQIDMDNQMKQIIKDMVK